MVFLTLFSGDEIRLSCVYNSKDGHRYRNHTVSWGQGSSVSKIVLDFCLIALRISAVLFDIGYAVDFLKSESSRRFL